MRPIDDGDATVEFRVLGPIELRLDGLIVDIGGFRQRRLLALLLSRAGGVVEADVLAEYVWDDDDRPENALEAVRTYISRLRRSFSNVGLDAMSLLVTQSPGYRLATDVEHVDIDINRFERLVLRARSQLDGGDAVSALVGLEDAIALWRGTPYQEFADRSWIEGEVVRLTELHRVAVEQRAAARLDLGAHAEVIGDLEQLVAEEPLRTRPVELLMLALYRSGRQAEALRVGSRYRRVVSDVGLDPPESVTDLESRIASSDRDLQPVLASTDTIRGYRLAEQIGEGSFSVVYRSVQPSLGREVAVKQIRAELADSPDFIRRFEAEAQLIAGLEHPHIVPLYDYWREPGSAYLVMRWLRGGTLEARLRRQRLDADESATLATQIGSALAAAHRAGVEHHDVRTANVFVDDIGNNYLGDFGIASHAITDKGGDDIRGLGGVLFEAVTGTRHSSNGQSQSLSTWRPDLPTAVEGVLLRALVGAGDERYIDVENFVDDYVGAIDGATRRRNGSDRVVPLVEDVVNPYKGLQAFQEADADDFRGRDRLIDRLLHQLASEEPEGRLIAVVGPSGAGKSSLVRAGLLPQVRAGAVDGSEGWFVTTMVPGRRPFDELEAALNRIASSPTASLVEVMRESTNGITRAVNSVLPDEHSELLVVIDQFEELFTFADDKTVEAFLNGLVAAVTDDRARLRVVVTIRADHWHHPLQHPELAQILEASAVTVSPMTANELERAIADPARRAAVTFEPGLVAEIIGEVHDRSGALPLMQYVLTELFDARDRGLMQFDTYRRLGGVTGALARRAEELYLQCSKDEQDGVRRLFSRLVTPGDGVDDTRRRALMSELTMVSGDLIDRFGAARMLSFDHDRTTREPTVELAHEALIGEWARLQGWVDDDRDGLRIMRRLGVAAADWDRTGRPASELYRGGRLDAADLWTQEHLDDLTELETSFMVAAIERRDAEVTTERRRVRRLRSLTMIAAAVAVVALIAGIIAVGQQRQADESRQQAVAAGEDERSARQEAETAADAERTARENADVARDDAVLRKVISDSAALRDRQPSLSLLLASEAYDRAPGDPATLGALLTSLQRTDGFLGYIPGTRTFSNDQWVGTLDDDTFVVRTDRSIDVYDLETRTMTGSWPAPTWLPGLGPYLFGSVEGGSFATVARRLSPNGIAIGGTVVLMVTADAPEPTALELDDLVPTAVGVGGNGSIVVGGSGGKIIVYEDADPDRGQTVGRQPFVPLSVALSPDGRLAAASDSWGNITLWDVESASARWSWTTGGQELWIATAGTIDMGSDSDSAPLVAGFVEGPPVASVRPAVGGVPGELRFSKDGRTVYSAISGLIAFDVDSGAQKWQVPGKIQFQLDELPDGRVLWHNQIIEDGIVTGEIDGLFTTSRTVSTPDGSKVIAMLQEGMRIISVTGDQLIASAVPRMGHNFATLNDDGSVVASFSEFEGSAVVSSSVRDVRSGTQIDIPPSTRSAFTKSGNLVSTPLEAELGRPTIVDFDTGALLGTLPEGLTWAAVQVSPGGDLASVSPPTPSDERAASSGTGIYDLPSSELPVILDDKLPLTGVSPIWMDFSPDGKLLAIANKGAAVIVNTETWETEKLLVPPEDDGYVEVAFTPDGLSLGLVAERGRLELYDIGGDELSTVVSGTVAALGLNNMSGLAFTADGEYALIAGNGANLVHLASGQLIGAPFETSQLVSGSSVAANGRALVTATQEDLLIWDLTFDDWPDLACRAAGRNMTLDEWEQFGWPGEPYRATCSEWPAATGSSE